MYNKVVLIGRMTADPELKTTPDGTNVTTFRIAVNRAHNRDKADFITVVAWRKSAEFVCNYFNKGSAIGVEGVIQTRDYTDKEGVKRNAFEVVAEKVFFVESKKKSDDNGYTDLNDMDDMPF